MWVYEEEVEGRKLTEIINTDHENVKYVAAQRAAVVAPGRWSQDRTLAAISPARVYTPASQPCDTGSPSVCRGAR